MIEVLEKPTYLATVRSEDTEFRYSQAGLKKAVQSGEVSRSSFVHYSPWTGDDFIPVWQVSQLTEFWQSPESLMISYLRERHTPWFSTLCFVLFFVIGLLHLRGWLGTGLIENWSVGWNNTILYGRWWSIWTAPFFHLNWGHWLGNVVLLYYCSFQVERIFGALGVWAVMVTSLFFGTILVLYLSEELVIGASMLVFGMWIAQVSIGFRLGESLPVKYRRNYGWGNFLLFVPVAMLNLYSKEVSQFAHLGGILAGGLVGFLYQPVTALISNKRMTRRILHFLQGFGLQALLAYSCIWLLENPRWSAYPWVPVEDLEDGYQLLISERFEQNDSFGLNAWQATTDGPSYFASSYWLREYDANVRDRALKQWWEDQLNISLKLAPVPFVDVFVPELGWDDLFLEGQDILIWEHSKQEGRFLLRIGCVLSSTQTPTWNICKEFVQSVQKIETLELTTTKNNHERYSQTPRYAIEYATLLQEYGRFHEIEAIYQKFLHRDDKYYWRGMDGLLMLRTKGFWIGNWSEDRHWMVDFIYKVPITERKTLLLAVQYAQEQGQCAWIEAMKNRWVGGLGEEWLEDLSDLEETCQ